MKVGVCGEEPLSVALRFDGSTCPGWAAGCGRPIAKRTDIQVVVGLRASVSVVHIVADWMVREGR